jgi:quercetin dioxygenase-like cupin family protein
MKSWTTTELELKPHAPAILSSNDDARIIALFIPAGESLDNHQVHERAFVVVIDGEVEITTETAGRISGSRGLLAEFAPNERHAVRAQSDAHLLLLLTPWPGPGHPGAMTLEKKASSRSDAARHKAGT